MVKKVLFISFLAICLFVGLANVKVTDTTGMDRVHAASKVPGEEPPDRKENLTKALRDLVREGTISQQQADTISTFMEKKRAEHKGPQGTPPGPPPDGRRPEEDGKGNHQQQMIKELMQAANLTQEQAQAVVKAMRPPEIPQERRPT